ncbi:rhodanese-like domain-containing protein [SAR86 cluster bacterium]|nr:rhodanese-like domain-containing protein [SAR86 cluster bacterium]
MTNSDNFYYIYAFYSCLKINKPLSYIQVVGKKAKNLKIIGTIIFTPEGINSTIASHNLNNLDNFIAFLEKDFGSISIKKSKSIKAPFKKLKIKTRDEIVPSGTDVRVDVSLNKYIEPENWNEFINDESVVTIDVRNNYEIGVGTFNKAVSPNTKNFREFDKYIKASKKLFTDKKLAIFCTGGIRCEKASALFHANGIDDVYQLEGGILNYFEKSSSTDNWTGDCFVFDDRVTVDKNLQTGSHTQCFACRRPLSSDDLLKLEYIEGISCHNCKNEKTEEDRQRFAERQKQNLLKKINDSY